jgi:hypothetical protein
MDSHQKQLPKMEESIPTSVADDNLLKFLLSIGFMLLQNDDNDKSGSWPIIYQSDVIILREHQETL